MAFSQDWVKWPEVLRHYAAAPSKAVDDGAYTRLKAAEQPSAYFQLHVMGYSMMAGEKSWRRGMFYCPPLPWRGLALRWGCSRLEKVDKKFWQLCYLEMMVKLKEQMVWFLLLLVNTPWPQHQNYEALAAAPSLDHDSHRSSYLKDFADRYWASQQHSCNQCMSSFRCKIHQLESTHSTSSGMQTFDICNQFCA